MKSIIEEASSITKAIESAWKRAGEPKEFSVRLYEMPQKNMFGFTTKSAKIGIFFEESKRASVPAKNMVPKQKAAVQQPQKKQKPQATVKQKRSEAEHEPWNKDMVAFAHDWLNKLLKHLHLHESATFKIDPQRYHLKIEFDKAIFDQEDKNRAFFRNCAHLMLQSVRSAFKRPLKGFKIVLTIK